MASDEIHVGDIGTVFELEVKDTDLNGNEVIVDISTATAMTIYFEKSDQTVLTKTAVHSTDGTDGLMRYVTIADDLDMSGGWKVQGKVTLPTGTWSTDIHKFKVYPNLS